MVTSRTSTQGLKFIGDDGWIWVTREGTAHLQRSEAKGAEAAAARRERSEVLDPNGLSVQLPRSKSHHLNWLECVRSRKQPLAPAPSRIAATAPAS